MNNDFLHYPVGPIAMKIAVAVGIGMLIGMERKWSHKEAGIRTFSIVALLGMLSAVISLPIIWRTVKDRAVVKRFTLELATIVFTGIAVICADQALALSDHFMQLFKS